MSCSDPPLTEQDIPAGIWLCHNCHMTQPIPPIKPEIIDAVVGVIPTSTTTSIVVPTTEACTISDTSRPNTPASGGIETDGPPIPEKIRNLRKRSSSRMSVSSDTSQTDRLSAKSSIVTHFKAQHNTQSPTASADIIVPPISDEPQRKLTALEELVRVASLMNPRQFELPREMNIYVQFPGVDKSTILYSYFLVYTFFFFL